MSTCADADATMAGHSPLKMIPVVAMTRANGIGVNGKLAWRLSKEMAHFKTITLQPSPGITSQEARNAVIMGRKTWESIPPKFRPLEGRINVVISREAGQEAEQRLGITSQQDSHLVNSLEAAADLLRSGQTTPVDRVFLLGGAQIYTRTIEHELAKATSAAALPPYSSVNWTNWTLDKLLVTRIHSPAYDECDVFLPEFRTPEQVEEDDRRGGIEGTEEQQHRGPQQPVWALASDAEFDDFAGQAVEHGIVEEKGARYSLQMWNKL